MSKLMYNDKLVYKVVIWVFLWGYFMEKKWSFKVNAWPFFLHTLEYFHICPGLLSSIITLEEPIGVLLFLFE